jgi:hypothetical protein
LDIDGTLVPAEGVDPPEGWFYKRVWTVSNPSANLKQVTVTAVVKTAVGSIGAVPRSTVTALKTFPF